VGGTSLAVHQGYQESVVVLSEGFEAEDQQTVGLSQDLYSDHRYVETAEELVGMRMACLCFICGFLFSSKLATRGTFSISAPYKPVDMVSIEDISCIDQSSEFKASI
jgi:hypothetical protein